MWGRRASIANPIRIKFCDAMAQVWLSCPTRGDHSKQAIMVVVHAVLLFYGWARVILAAGDGD